MHQFRMLVSTVGISFMCKASPAVAVNVGDKLSSLNVITPATGASHNLSTAEKVTIVNFWATWCEACKVEIKEMQEKFKGIVADKNLQVAFVALDKDPAKAKEWFAANVAAGPWQDFLYADPSFKIADDLGVDAFPMTLVVRADGTVMHIQRGFNAEVPSTEQIAAKAGELLKGSVVVTR